MLTRISQFFLILWMVCSTPSLCAQGLYGEYFNHRNFGQEEPLTRLDSQVNFNWENGSPMEGIRNNQFSVRWRGWFVPRYSESYFISTRSDDGVRSFLRVRPED